MVLLSVFWQDYFDNTYEIMQKHVRYLAAWTILQEILWFDSRIFLKYWWTDFIALYNERLIFLDLQFYIL